VATGTAELSDGELIERARGGDREAFAVIYRRYHVGLYRFARGMTGSLTMAEDATQEVFLTFMRQLDRYDPLRGTLSTYLYSIARNVVRYWLRKERRFVPLELALSSEPVATGDPAAAAMQRQAVTRIRNIIRALSPRYREVLILCDLQEMSYEQAAVVLNTRVGTVRSRLHRARHQLAGRLNQTPRARLLCDQETWKSVI
jgi:RNA polymerase sigma-70 factor (ECF subfamily)